jgi:hypothetical protein
MKLSGIGLGIGLGAFVGSYPVTTWALDSSNCDGPSIPYTDKCGSRIEYYHVCLGPNGTRGTINFTINPGGTHAFNVLKGSSYTSGCAQPSNNCPAQWTILLAHCAP